MSEVPLPRLRILHGRAEELLRHLVRDLKPFLHSDGETFRRTPDSESIEGDVNVTTTCSCLMALALTDKFATFYGLSKQADPKEKAQAIFDKIVAAPWSSSGLTENNAFTTTLVLRTFGFLLDEKLLANNANPEKEWALNLGIAKPVDLGQKLKNRTGSTSEFLWLSLSDKSRLMLADPVTPEKKIAAALELDLRRIIQSGWIYEEARFQNAPLEVKQELEELRLQPNAYKTARLNHQLIASEYPAEIAQPIRLSLAKIASLMSAEPEQFGINAYQPCAAVVYWFVDGVARAEISLEAGSWTKLCDWAVNEFSRQRSLAIAEHDAMMDPVAVAMAACLCARLRILSSRTRLGMTNDHLAILPSGVELEHAIQDSFKKQAKSGIWPKYFPLFHYQDAGSNFCFTFELLEAVLYEFGRFENSLFDSSAFLEGLERAVTWCEKNTQKWSDAQTEYTGWNSGGYLQALKAGQPESWATAVVHMFLQELHTALGVKIRDALLKSYQARTKVPETSWDKLIDVEVRLPDAKTLKELIEKEVIEHAAGFDPRVDNKMNGRLSALLFGPPGTAKTELTRAVAAKLKWPLIELDPSNFLSKGIENIYQRAEEIFADLLLLSKVIVLFDEMDALVQTRGESAQPLDVTSRFLTTSMLPKLARLHDKARLIFFFATNYPESFDPAIKRPGRFDILVCVGPPTWQSKLEGLDRLLPNVSSADLELIRTGLQGYATEARPDELELLNLLTFRETRTFLQGLLQKATPPVPSKDSFFNGLRQFSTCMTLRPEPREEKPNSQYKRFKEQQAQSQTQ